MMDCKIEIDRWERKKKARRPPFLLPMYCQPGHSPSPILSWVLGWQPLAALPYLTSAQLNGKNFPTAAYRHLPWRHAHAAITQQGFCVDALNIAWPAGTYPVSMYLTRQKEYGHVHGNAQPIITLLEIYDISTL